MVYKCASSLPSSAYLITLKEKTFQITFHSFLLKDKQLFKIKVKKIARKNFHILQALFHLILNSTILLIGYLFHLFILFYPYIYPQTRKKVTEVLIHRVRNYLGLLP